MRINHLSLKSDATIARNKLMPNGVMGIGELLKLPQFFDWVDCQPTEKNHFKMYLAGADDGIALRFFWNGYYERATLRAWSAFASQGGGVILDVGAHTGAYTLAAFAANENATVISFEPHFMNFARLNMNLRGNGFNPNGICMLGVGEKEGVLPFSVSTNISYLSSGGSVGVRENASVANIKIVALDEFLPTKFASQITLIKIDVEGYESACLRGMSKIINNCRPTIFLECIDELSSLEVSENLTQLGYCFYLVDDLNGEITRVEKLTPETDGAGKVLMNRLNRIALPNESLIKKLY